MSLQANLKRGRYICSTKNCLWYHFIVREGKLMQFVSVLRLVCGFMKLRIPSPFLCYCASFFTLHWKQQKPIMNHQHCRAKLRARCLRSSWHVLPIDGSVNTVACCGHIMAASDSHHSGPVSYKSCKRGWRGMPPPLLCSQISSTWNQARNSEVLNVESPAKRRQAKRN